MNIEAVNPIAEVHLDTLFFEKVFTSARVLSEPIKLGKKMRIEIEYDPQKSKTVIRYFNE